MNQEIYALEKKQIKGHSVFLAGPTPRNASVPSWRPEMIQNLRKNEYAGDILIPEKRGNYLDYEYETQTRWEVEHLNKSSCILFWIPRNIPNMPAFTTNIEFGEWMHSKKILLAYPQNAEKMRYLKVRADMHNIPTVHTIVEAVNWVINHEKMYKKYNDNIT